MDKFGSFLSLLISSELIYFEFVTHSLFSRWTVFTGPRKARREVEPKGEELTDDGVLPVMIPTIASTSD